MPDFFECVEKLFRGILEKKTSSGNIINYIPFFSEDQHVKRIFDLLFETRLFYFDAALWLPCEGKVAPDSLDSLRISVTKKPVLYKLDWKFLARYEFALKSARSVHKEASYPLAKDIFRDKISNDIIKYLEDTAGDRGVDIEYINQIIGIFRDYNINKGVEGVHCCYNGFNMLVFYRRGDSYDFNGSEMIFVKKLIPFLHLISSIKIIPFFALFDEKVIYKPILSKFAKGFEGIPFISILLDEINQREGGGSRDVYRFYGTDKKTNVTYMFFAVRIYDVRQNSNCSPLLAVTSIFAENFISGKYKAIYEF